MENEVNTTGGPPGVESGAEDRVAVQRELLSVLLGHTRMALVGNVAIGIATVGVVVGAGIYRGVLAWALCLLSLVVIRAWHARRAAPEIATLEEPALRRLEWQLTVLVGSSGLTWGALPWLVYTGEDPFVDFFSVAMLVGMTSGAVASTMALPRALNTYVSAAFVPFIVKAMLIGGSVHTAGALTIMFSMVVLMGFGRTGHDALRRTVLLSRQNARLMEELRIERDAVRAAMQAKDLFLAGVTHDLRQPVHALGLHLHFLRSLRQDEVTPATLEEVCAPMDAATKSMSTQLSRLLELSRLEAGEAKVSRRPIAVSELFEASESQFQPLAREKGLRLRFRRSGAIVDSDPKMLQSIVDNLVSNALRYTDDGTVLVGVRRRGALVELQVLDEGPGIPENLVPQLFIAYRRFDDRKDRAEEGQGLGLALVRKQSDLLGHAVAVRSEVGRGSVFSVTVPVAPADARAVAL